MIRVSVIIPCYNQAVFLPKAVASLQAQTLGEWECIVVDDGSTDNTTEVAANISLREPRVRLLQKTNGGSASARDLGLQHAKGAFIQFLDADDTIAPEKLEKQTIIMEQNGSDISYTAFCSEENNHQTKPRFVSLDQYKLFVLWGLGASVPIHSFLYRTDFIRSNHLSFQSECRYREDWRWHMACFAAKPKLSALPEYSGAIYFHHGQGKTSTHTRMQEGNFAFMNYMTPRLKGIWKALWALRISEELWIWFLRMLKYRSTDSARTIAHLYADRSGKQMMAVAILLMPLSLLLIIVYFVKTYITK